MGRIESPEAVPESCQRPLDGFESLLRRTSDEELTPLRGRLHRHRTGLRQEGCPDARQVTRPRCWQSWPLWPSRPPRPRPTPSMSRPVGMDTWTGLEPNCVGPDGPKATIQAGIGTAATSGIDEVVVAAGDVSSKPIDFHRQGDHAAELGRAGGDDHQSGDWGGPDVVTCEGNGGDLETVLRGVHASPAVRRIYPAGCSTAGATRR